MFIPASRQEKGLLPLHWLSRRKLAVTRAPSPEKADDRGMHRVLLAYVARHREGRFRLNNTGRSDYYSVLSTMIYGEATYGIA